MTTAWQRGALEIARQEAARLLDLAERALLQVDDAGFVAPLGEDGNSLAILVKHMAGNLASRWTDFLTSDGEKPDRHRDGEFVVEDADTRAALMERWRLGWQTFLGTLADLGDDDLGRVVTIRGEPHSVPQAIQRQLGHYAYHVGQIVQLARHRAGRDWQSLSIPRGGSEQFNQRPERYHR